MCDGVIAQIDVLVKGRTPVIGIASHEESRIEAELKALIDNQNAERLAKGRDAKRLVSWSIARGFVELLPEPADPSHPTVTVCPDPIKAILTAGGLTPSPDDRPTIYLLKDIHPYLRSVPQALRALRDAASSLRRSNSSIILVGPTLEIPEDAKKDVRLVDFPLPTPEEIDGQIGRFIANLPDGLNKLNGDRGTLVRALQGLTRIEADQVLGQAVVKNRSLDERAIQFSLDAKAQIIRESGALDYIANKASYGEIGGLDLLKGWARRSELAGTPEAKAFGVEAPRGVLIVGVPGCGKSLTAKAIAGPNRPLLRLDVGALFGSLVGQSEGQTRNALKVAEAVAPCVLWIDEIEKALGGGGGETDGGTSTRVLGTILTWLEESSDAGVFVVATANDIGSLRPELIRRFDEVFFVDLPTAEERAEILSIHLGKRKRNGADFDLDAVVKATEDYTGSELEKIVKAGLIRAFHAGRELETDDLLVSATETVPLKTTAAESIKGLRKWAERARPASSRQDSGYTATTTNFLELD